MSLFFSLSVFLDSYVKKKKKISFSQTFDKSNELFSNNEVNIYMSVFYYLAFPHFWFRKIRFPPTFSDEISQKYSKVKRILHIPNI